MAITYKAGRRIQGTSTDFAGIAGVTGGWKEVGRTTLGSSNADIVVSGLADKRYYKVLTSISGTNNTTNRYWRLNSDTGNNYSERFNYDNSGDHTQTSQTAAFAIINQVGTVPSFSVSYFANISTKEKLFQIQGLTQNTAGAGTAPNRYNMASKHAQTTNPISTITLNAGASGTFNTGSEVVVLGWDDSDTHSTNFWEELASVTNSGGSTNNFGTGSFTAKKYLWVQAFVKNDGACSPRFRVGTGGTIDTGTNIASRSSSDGGADGTALSRDDMVISISSTSENHFINMFMVNNASNEKLAIHNCITVGTAGAGTAPQRREGVSKYSNTSAQVNIIELEDADASAGLGDGTIIKVWGSN